MSRHNTFRYGTNIFGTHNKLSDTLANIFDADHDTIEKPRNTRYARGCSRERHARSAECHAGMSNSLGRQGYSNGIEALIVS